MINQKSRRRIFPIALMVALVLLLPAFPGQPGRAGEAPDEPGEVIILTLEDAVEAGKALRLHMEVAAGHIRAAFATGANALLHDVDSTGLIVERGRISGHVAITLNPDNFIPADGQSVSSRYTLAVSMAESGITGEYEGFYGEVARKGRVVGTVAPRPDYAQSFQLRARLFGALHRLYAAKGPNWKYALDMSLICRMNDGRAIRPRFETIVPDYRRYSAIVEQIDLTIRGNEIVGVFSARVDYAGQGAARNFKDPVELHTYTLRGTVIGDVVGGIYAVKVGDDHTGTNLRFAGSLDFSPAPAPTQSLAFIRLHDAMSEGPVLLQLSLADDGLINGLAYASGYNHQPHTVDGSGLTLSDRALRGKVNVSIVPDAYKPPERFTLTYDLDLRIEDDAIAGSFTGVDRGRAVKGSATGQLRAKRVIEHPITIDTVTRCELQLGYSLHTVGRAEGPWAGVPINHANVRFTIEAGKVAVVQIFNPVNAQTFSAELAEAALNINGDQLTGTVSFDLRSEVVREGRYTFTFEAIIDGDRLIGFWRGTHDGKDILTKSAKLGGRIHSR